MEAENSMSSKAPNPAPRDAVKPPASPASPSQGLASAYYADAWSSVSRPAPELSCAQAHSSRIVMPLEQLANRVASIEEVLCEIRDELQKLRRGE